MFLLLNPHKWDPPSPPAALDYVAWELEKMGIESEIVDLAFTEMEEAISLVQRTPYEGICVTIRNLEKTMFSEKLHFPLPSIRDLVQVLKKYCNCPIILGGSGFSIIPERILTYVGADYGIWGGGEESLPLLLKCLSRGEGDLQSIPYLVYHQGNSMRKNPPSPYLKYLPPVKRGYLDYTRYFHPGHEHFPGFGIVETKRGCPHACVYCVEPHMKGRKVRVKDPNDVQKEVDWLVNKGITHLFLADSEFNADIDHAVELCTVWKEREHMKWITYMTPSHFTEELAELLPKSGNLCTMIDFGHVNNSILQHLGKEYTFKDIEAVISLCQDHKVNFRGSLLLGGPGENRETVAEAVNFFKGVNCKLFLVLGVRVFPHTPLGEYIQRSPLVDDPNLYGKVIENDDLFEPVYYISQGLGEDIFDYLLDLTGTSEQFYMTTPPFRLTSQMHNNFRGTAPVYETAGTLDVQCMTRFPQKSPVFEDPEAVS